MDCRYPNLMAREDLIRILKERQLKIPNIDELPHDELIKIFCKFAVPLGRRADKAFNSTDYIPLTTIDKNKTYNGKTNCLKRNLSSTDENCNNKIEKLGNNSMESEYKKHNNSNNTENMKNKKQKICWP